MQRRSATRKWTTYDVAKALLAFMDRSTVPACSSSLHPALRSVAVDQRFARFFQGYTFDLRHPFPFCPAFQTDLVNLEMSGHLTTANPDLIRLKRTAKLKRTFESYGRSLFTLDELSDLQKMAKAFTRALQRSPAPALAH